MLIHRREDPAAAAAAQRDLLSDERLSLLAVAVLMKILNHAPEWQINAKTFAEECEEARGRGAESKRGIRMSFRELEELGYMRRTKGRKSSGDFYTTLEATDVPHDFTVATRGREHGIMPEAGSGVVYVVGPAVGSVVKIGTTTNLPSRMNGLQTGHPLLLLGRWTCTGNAELEMYLHRRFDHIRMMGEWFDFGGADPVVAVAAAAEEFYRMPPGSLSGPDHADLLAG